LPTRRAALRSAAARTSPKATRRPNKKIRILDAIRIEQPSGLGNRRPRKAIDGRDHRLAEILDRSSTSCRSGWTVRLESRQMRKLLIIAPAMKPCRRRPSG